MWALWPLDNEETRLFLELDFPEGRRVVLVSVARTGGRSSLYLYEGKLGELTRADRQQDNSAGDTADSAHWGERAMIYLNI